jgi:hypothetical protein
LQLRNLLLLWAAELPNEAAGSEEINHRRKLGKSDRPRDRSGAWTSPRYLDALSSEFVADCLAEMEDESFGCSIGRHIGDRLKTGVRGNVDDATFTSCGHCFTVVMSESDQRLHIHLNFSLLLLAVMGKKCAAQTESRII